jgi:hypothetical protein
MGTRKSKLPQVERRSFSVRTFAARNDISVSKAYDEVAEGRLRVVRPWPGGPMQVTTEAENDWLHGRTSTA